MHKYSRAQLQFQGGKPSVPIFQLMVVGGGMSQDLALAVYHLQWNIQVESTFHST